MFFMSKIEKIGFDPDECFLDDDGILRFVLRGVHTLEQNIILNRIIDETAADLRSQGRPVLILVNIAGVEEVPFSAKRNIAQESLRIDMDGLCYVAEPDSPYVPILRLVLKLYDPNRFSLVEDEASARKWLVNYSNRKFTEDRRPG
jgi:hypothetical protein